jgi:hypothetical protein
VPEPALEAPDASLVGVESISELTDLQASQQMHRGPSKDAELPFDEVDGEEERLGIAVLHGATNIDQADFLPPAPKALVKTPGENFVTRRVARNFEVDDRGRLEVYYATVTAYFPAEENEANADLWRIVYDDEDMEDFTKDELNKALKLYAKQKSPPPVAAVANAAKLDAAQSSIVCDADDSRKPVGMPTSLEQPTTTATLQTAVVKSESLPNEEDPRPWPIKSKVDSLDTVPSNLKPDRAPSPGSAVKRDEEITPMLVKSEGYHEGSPDPIRPDPSRSSKRSIKNNQDEDDSLDTVPSNLTPDRAPSPGSAVKRDEEITPMLVKSEGYHEGSPDPIRPDPSRSSKRSIENNQDDYETSPKKRR